MAPAAASRQCTEPFDISVTSGRTAPASAIATLFSALIARFQSARAPYSAHLPLGGWRQRSTRAGIAPADTIATL